MNYRLLAIDIDGTLVNSRDELTPATRAAIARATAAGIHVVLATGRRYRRALGLVESLGLSVPLVTASGALVKDPTTHETLYRASSTRRLSARCWSRWPNWAASRSSTVIRTPRASTSTTPATPPAVRNSPSTSIATPAWADSGPTGRRICRRRFTRAL